MRKRYKFVPAGSAGWSHLDFNFAMLIQLIVRNEGQAGKRIQVNQPFFLIGRDESCSLRTRSHSVSLKHCVIVQKKGRVYIKDLDSRNGTYLNGEPLPRGHASQLFHRDKLQIGKMSFRLSIRDSETQLPIARPDEEEIASSPSDTVRFLNKSKFRSIKQDPL